MIKINTGTFPINAYLVIGNDYSAIYKLLKKKQLKDCDIKTLEKEFNTGGGFSITFEQSTSIVWVLDIKDKNIFLGILAHELTHLTFQIMNHCGIDYKKSSANETFCYQFEFMFNDVVKKLNLIK